MYGDVATKAITKSKFHADTLTIDGDFFYFAAGTPNTCYSNTYRCDGNQDDLCIPVVNYYNANGTDGLVDLFADYAWNHWTNTLGLGDPREFA